MTEATMSKLIPKDVGNCTRYRGTAADADALAVP